MSISIKSNPDGVSGAIQINGADAIPFNTGGVTGERRLKQVVTYQTSAQASGTTIIPMDNTTPQNTEGDQYMSLSITPTNVNSTLEIEVIFNGGISIAHDLMVALFQDSAPNALAVNEASIYISGAAVSVVVNHLMAAGTTSPTTFKVRAGGGAACTTTFNRYGFGGVTGSRITIKEYLPA